MLASSVRVIVYMSISARVNVLVHLLLQRALLQQRSATKELATIAKSKIGRRREHLFPPDPKPRTYGKTTSGVMIDVQLPRQFHPDVIVYGPSLLWSSGNDVLICHCVSGSNIACGTTTASR